MHIRKEQVNFISLLYMQQGSSQKFVLGIIKFRGSMKYFGN